MMAATASAGVRAAVSMTRWPRPGKGDGPASSAATRSAAQPGSPAASGFAVGGQPDVGRSQPGPAGAQEVRELAAITGGHGARWVARSVPEPFPSSFLT